MKHGLEARYFVFLVIGALVMLSGLVWIQYQSSEKSSLENVLSPFSGGINEQPQEKSAYDAFLTGSWYKVNDATERENGMYAISGDHRRYGIYFDFIHKKQWITDCKVPPEGEGPWQFTCVKDGDDKKLLTTFDFIDGDTIPTEEDILNIKTTLIPLVHAIKRIGKGKILILSSSPQDATSFFLLYIVKISDDLYLEVLVESEYICTEDLSCQKKLPNINSEETYEFHKKFLWQGIEDGLFPDPIMKSAYDMLFYIENNWKDAMETAPNW